MGSTQALVGTQLEQRIQDTVKAAVKEMLSQVPVSKEPNTGPQISVKGPEEESSGWMKKEEQLEKPNLLESNMLQIPAIPGPEMKFDPRAQYPTPRSLTFSRSPEVQLAAMDKSLPEPNFLEQGPRENDFYPLFPENGSGNVLHEMAEGNLFEFDRHVSSTCAGLSNSDAALSALTAPVFTSAGPSFSQVAAEPAGLQTQQLSSSEKAELDSYTLGPWGGFSQSMGSEYEPAFSYSDSNAFEILDLQEQAVEPFIFNEHWSNEPQL